MFFGKGTVGATRTVGATQGLLDTVRWTAKQAVNGAAKLPPKLATLLASLGIDASMWRDLVWNFKKYFGRGVCAGSPEAMAEDAKRNGRHWHRGQKTARAFFATG